MDRRVDDRRRRQLAEARFRGARRGGARDARRPATGGPLPVLSRLCVQGKRVLQRRRARAEVLERAVPVPGKAGPDRAAVRGSVPGWCLAAESSNTGIGVK